MTTPRPKLKPQSTEKIPPTARQGGWHMGAIMFDIGVNLTSSQFSRDHDEVVARAPLRG